MSDKPPRRTLPPLLHLEKLKKQAKVRLADMRSRAPSARLADAQFLLARDYGFENWAALKTEVERRSTGSGAAALRGDRARALFRAMQHRVEEEDAIQSPVSFFRAGMAMLAVFMIVTLVGALLFLHPGPGSARLMEAVHRLQAQP